MPWIVKTALLAVLVGAFFTAPLACGNYEGRYDGDPIDKSTGGSDDDAGPSEDAFPDMTWTDHEGNPLRLYDFFGDVVILNGGAGWCVPCREEAPLLESDLYQVYKDDGFTIIELMVENNDGREPDLAFINEWRDEYGITYPIVLDPEWTLEPYFIEDSLPFSLFLDRDLVPRYKSHGYDRDAYRQLIESLL
ncbi:MAG: TlpA family protein disulfide reductase [Deltaproteobacteria bacterium]|nr:TlpA family protein disulfide reductase [Deltaproteobacteria bacterium]